MHLDMYDNVGKELFLQTLCIMMGELRKRYQKVENYKCKILCVDIRCCFHKSSCQLLHMRINADKMFFLTRVLFLAGGPAVIV